MSILPGGKRVAVTAVKGPGVPRPEEQGSQEPILGKWEGNKERNSVDAKAPSTQHILCPSDFTYKARIQR